jgi:thymidylate synthase
VHEGRILKTFVGQTADEAWRSAGAAYRNHGGFTLEFGRSGPAWELLQAAFVIEEPRQRWVLSRTPAMSVPFALVEVVGILAGRRDASYLNFFNPRLPKYSGDGDNYHGAYG